MYEMEMFLLKSNLALVFLAPAAGRCHSLLVSGVGTPRRGEVRQCCPPSHPPGAPCLPLLLPDCLLSYPV
jgi:hypothetical protein